MTQSASPDSKFDAAHYWQERHEKYRGILATGTLGAPVSWQHWLYRGKVRAYRRALRAAGITVTGGRVLDFGCGTGYFEDVWESLGAKDTAGIDLVADVIDDLSIRYPNRSYRAGNLANDADLMDGLGRFDLITAIDVLYHIVHDSELDSVISRLSAALSDNGYLLFTDALTQCSTAPHVRFRPLEFWERTLAIHGLSVIHSEPVFVVQNRPNAMSRRAPWLCGALAYWADLPLNLVFPKSANNFALIARCQSSGQADRNARST